MNGVNPCEYSDGTGAIYINLAFTETYGGRVRCLRLILNSSRYAYEVDWFKKHWASHSKLVFSYLDAAGDHLPTLGEEQSLSVIAGQVRQASDPTGAQTVQLRLYDSTPNKFANGTSFSAVGDYFQLSIRSGTGYISLKQGIDREVGGWTLALFLFLTLSSKKTLITHLLHIF